MLDTHSQCIQSRLNEISHALIRDQSDMLIFGKEQLQTIIQFPDPKLFNLNLFPNSGKVLYFYRNKSDKKIMAEVYSVDSNLQNLVPEGELGLVRLLKEGIINNALIFPGYDIILANVKLESCTLLAGSFNPIHEGHIALLDTAEHAVRAPLACFELSVANASSSKAEIGENELFDRVDQFKDIQSLLVTRRPYFRDKIAFMQPNSWLVIGADTFKRFFDLQYYESPAQMIEFASLLDKQGVKLIVGPRLSQNILETRDDFLDMVPQFYRPSVLQLEKFRVDKSSTEIREARARQQQKVALSNNKLAETNNNQIEQSPPREI